jgi:hypothetical protein
MFVDGMIVNKMTMPVRLSNYAWIEMEALA